MNHYRIINDTLTPLGSILVRDGNPVNLTGLTVKFKMFDNAAVEVIAETVTGVSIHPNYAFTVSGNFLVSNSHGVKDGDEVEVTTVGTLPSGLSASTRYYAVNCESNRFQLSLTANGDPITLASAGSGTLYYFIIGSVQYTFQSADVDTAGTFWGYWVVINGSARDTFPAQRRNLKIPQNFIKIIIGAAT